MTRPLLHVGVDFGGTKISAGVVASGGEIVGRGAAATEADRGVEHVVSRLASAIDEACAAAGTDPRALGSIGVAAAGQIDAATGVVVHGPNLRWFDVPLARILRDRYPGVPVAIENDVNAACLGEVQHGAARGVRDVVAVFVGTGIGGGIVAGGALVKGATGAAGEIGHMIYRPEGDPCSCGGRGHFESYAGGAPVEANFRARVRRGLDTLALELAGGSAEAIGLGTIFEAADRGDRACAEVVSEFERALAVLAASLASALNPALVVLGGGVVRRRRALVPVVEAGVRELATEAAGRACRVAASALWDDAAILGSAEAAARLRGEALAEGAWRA